MHYMLYIDMLFLGTKKRKKKISESIEGDIEGIETTSTHTPNKNKQLLPIIVPRYKSTEIQSIQQSNIIVDNEDNSDDDAHSNNQIQQQVARHVAPPPPRPASIKNKSSEQHICDEYEYDDEYYEEEYEEELPEQPVYDYDYHDNRWSEYT